MNLHGKLDPRDNRVRLSAVNPTRRSDPPPPPRSCDAGEDLTNTRASVSGNANRWRLTELFPSDVPHVALAENY